MQPRFNHNLKEDGQKFFVIKRNQKYIYTPDHKNHKNPRVTSEIYVERNQILGRLEKTFRLVCI